MRLHRPLDDLLRGKGTLHVLRELCRQPSFELSAPELARTGGLALSHVQGALAVLEGHGLVNRHVVGRRHLWTIAGDNALLPELRSLFDRERRLSEDLVKDLTWGLASAPLTRATLFGSVAKGNEKGWSDVDLLVEIGSEGQREQVWDALLPLTRRLRERFGLNLAPIVVTPRQRRASMSPSFLATVSREGRVIRGPT